MRKKNGFTLIELLVALAIFSIVVGISMAIFLSALQIQRKALALERLLDQTNYVMEYMSRALRMAKKQTAEFPVCLSQNGLNYEITRAGKGLKFLNYQGICQEFFLDVNLKRLKELKGGSEEFLTSSELEVESFNIKVSGASEQDTDQPRVTLFLKIKGKGQKPEEKPEIKIQTTISQRDLDYTR
jgi:prepilin-type N-terminal cleavage/methylation domain-containing protein